MEEEQKLNKKEHLFSFAKLNGYYLFPFLAPLFCCTANIFIYFLYFGDQGQNQEKQNNELFITIIIDLSYVFGGLLYFISAIRTKTEETRDKAEVYRPKAMIKLIYNKGDKKDKKKIFLILILLSILITITTLSNLYELKYVTFEKRLYFIFYIALFSKIILKNEIFNHQKLSLFIAVIGFFFLCIQTISNMSKIQGKDIFFNILFNIINFFSAGCFCLFIVMIKYLTHKYFFSPLLCLLLVGLFSLIITFIGFIIYSLIVKDYNFSLIIENLKLFFNNEIQFYIYLILALLFASILQVFEIFVIYYFCPILLCVTDSISPMLFWILGFFIKKQDVQDDHHSISDIILISIGYFLQIIAGLIYNEIIICNFMNFNKNTKKRLQEREQEELLSLKKIENSFTSNYSDENQREIEDASDNSEEEEVEESNRNNN